MKTPTDSYKRLKKTLSDIKTILSRVPPLFCETDLQHLKVQSYVLLCHAAFEEYIEELSRSVSNKAIELLNTEGIITKSLVSMTAWETIAQIDENIPRKKIKLDVAGNFKTFANASKVNLHKQIDENHGIRKDNQKSLLIPIGVDPEAVDFATFAALDSLGVSRGHIAHKVKIQREHTRNAILADVDTIFRGLQSYDAASCECIKLRMQVAN
ncbi:HEPN domain-containing protein [Brucella intermedia]|uniref:HEPN domain-containing protein n=1 Tax=Brucella intermedia TaxID=94625 RepID=UPI000EFB3273|nr:HEPN domain-containing protein [Brucella intermedia]KAB2720394.1 hypothetical protein F9K75_04800 [Brucella intermedia]